MSENMKLWNSVCETDPAVTKHVTQRGGFTAICAQSQRKRATELWGPYGGKWGVKDLKYGFLGPQEMPVEVSLSATFYYPGGECALSVDMTYKVGNDSCKKLLTDLTTKALSMLGFNSDVFEGKYDDNKYVEALKKKNGKKPAASPSRQPDGAGSSKPAPPASPVDQAKEVLGASEVATVTPPTCWICGVPMKLRESGPQSKNPGSKFWSCTAKDENDKWCPAFVWADKVADGRPLYPSIKGVQWDKNTVLPTGWEFADTVVSDCPDEYFVRMARDGKGAQSLLAAAELTRRRAEGVKVGEPVGAAVGGELADDDIPF